jgi:hypothetical protein
MAETESPVMVATAGRRRQSPEYWRGQVEAWRASGLSQSEYCRRGGVHWYGFRYWKSKTDFERAGEAGGGTKLVEVKVPVRQPAGGGPVRIQVAGRYLLEVSPGFDGSTLRSVIELLERR